MGCEVSKIGINNSIDEKEVTIQVVKEKGKEMEQESSYQIISKWLNLRELKLIDFLSKDITKLENNGYEKLNNLTSITLNNDTSKEYLFDNKEDSVMIYIEGENIFDDMSIEEIINKFSKPEEILRSRGSKRALHYVYSKNGFAFSALDDEIIFFEVFPDCSLRDYKENIYIKPPLFIK